MANFLTPTFMRAFTANTTLEEWRLERFRVAARRVIVHEVLGCGVPAEKALSEAACRWGYALDTVSIDEEGTFNMTVSPTCSAQQVIGLRAARFEPHIRWTGC